ncbi:hypothetical protein AVEN_115116-1 [Araneus ventricosus]|uniref:Uncharacterized protein n=1 Tax=Araneus ventricosus TaxID=182803 RepID=A0A4Y1ZXB4_ARAVE|nr:hypothetical protein AVEN_115116-1 [Araneus ventricosus]
MKTTLKPCSNGVWLGQTSSRSRFAFVDCGRWNSNRRTVPTAHNLEITRTAEEICGLSDRWTEALAESCSSLVVSELDTVMSDSATGPVEAARRLGFVASTVRNTVNT